MGSKKKEKKGKSESAVVARTDRGRSKKLKTYTVFARCMVTHGGFADIEAYSEEEAIENAEDLEFDWESFDDCADFQVTSVEPVWEVVS